MDNEEILEIEYQLKKRFLQLSSKDRFKNGFALHETTKSFLSEYFHSKGLISIPEYRIDFFYKGRRIERMRKGRIDLVVKDNNNNLIYGIEIDGGLSKSSIAKINALNPEQKIIVSLSASINRHLWKLPKDFILIYIPRRKVQYNLNDFHVQQQI
jgi:hypothetical protein